MPETPDFEIIEPPSGGTITVQDGKLDVPDDPILPVIIGDGIGPDIMNAAQPVLETAVEVAYGGERSITWFEVPAGEASKKAHDDYLPQDTVDAIAHFKVALKGPLTTPVGTGIRSLNVALRQLLDLYACVRPVYWVEGVPSPIRTPEDVDMVIFRENTEDVYAGIEWEAGSDEVEKVKSFLVDEMGVTGKFHDGPIGIGIKPITEFGTKRLVRKAIEHALENGRESVTLVHKGNIMKFTEGAFRDWGYEVAAQEFPDQTLTEQELWDDHDGEIPDGKIVIKDRIADNMLQQLVTRTSQYDVLALPNLNGDYLSDAAAGLIGGLGIAPGGNISDDVGLFEATHGTAPKYAGMDKVNPTSVILSGVLMLEHMGWREAAELVRDGIRETVQQQTVTYDLARQMDGVEPVKTSEFGQAIEQNIRKLGA